MIDLISPASISKIFLSPKNAESKNFEINLVVRTEQKCHMRHQDLVPNHIMSVVR